VIGHCSSGIFLIGVHDGIAATDHARHRTTPGNA